jgi:hypothetical protein
MLKAVLEPIVLGCKPDQHAGRSTVPPVDDNGFTAGGRRLLTTVMLEYSAR